MSQSRQKPRVLLVDEDHHVVGQMQATLASHFTCDIARSGEAAATAIQKAPFDIVVLRHELRGSNALELLAAARSQRPSIRVILFGRASGKSVLEAGRRGAYDYLTAPVEAPTLLASVARAAQHPGLPESPPQRPTGSRSLTPVIIGQAPALLEALEAVERVAVSSAPVLIIGETGTGKDLLATRIHARGPRRQRPFIVVNCGAIPASLLDSELCGHVAGAFTGATRARPGLIVEADKSTLFLDEIADLPLELQGRFLRVLEANAVRPVGGDNERQVDVRFIAATQRDLSHAVRAGKFRDDLYYRLNVLTVHAPPLRERRDDLPALIQYFFDDARVRNPHSPVTEIAPPAHARLMAAAWPGNVRELRACIERLVVLGNRPRIDESDIAAIEATRATDALPRVPAALASHELGSLRDMTTRHIERVLAHTNGDKVRAATILGVNVSTLYRRGRRGG